MNETTQGTKVGFTGKVTKQISEKFIKVHFLVPFIINFIHYAMEGIYVRLR